VSYEEEDTWIMSYSVKRDQESVIGDLVQCQKRPANFFAFCRSFNVCVSRVL
jgi:hypothetical protein